MSLKHCEFETLLRQAQDTPTEVQGAPAHYHEPHPAVFQALQLHAKQSGAWCARRAGVDAAPHRDKGL